VIAARQWGVPMERMPLPPAREGSWEDALHRAGGDDGLLVFSGSEVEQLLEERDHRAIGVVYDPGSERYGNYVPTVLPPLRRIPVPGEDLGAGAAAPPVERRTGRTRDLPLRRVVPGMRCIPSFRLSEGK
jgi:hypothetical protein